MNHAQLQEAVRLHRAGDLEAAEVLYERMLAEDARQPDALHFLGVLRHQQGRSDEAIDLLRNALAVAPGYVDAWNNLGNIQKENGQLRAAEAAYREALARNPSHPGAWNNLGVVLRAREAYEEAVAAYEEVLRLTPDTAHAYHNLALALRASGRIEEALSAYRRALSLNPTNPSTNVAFGYLLFVTGRVEEAQALFRDWLHVEPGNSIAEHMLAACSGENVPEHASADYVRHTFDGFATRFDEQLLERLSYRAPQLVAASLGSCMGQPSGSLDVLDAGCGTGLCGPLLRPYAHQLSGVDLSPGMLARARARGGYDQLHEAELVTFLSARTSVYDAIVSADTLVYVGALEVFSAAAHGALKRGGCLVFTTERAEGEGTFRLNPHGRYSHTEPYLHRVLSEAGFVSLHFTREVLRTELNRPVEGWLVRAQAS